jgi:hypothetical protein
LTDTSSAEPRSFPSAHEVATDTLRDLLDTPPQVLTDLRFAELEARRVAEDQVLVELLANARDAVLGHRGPSTPRVRLEREGDALLVANDGVSWAREGYEAVRRIGGSPKRHLPRPAGAGQPAIPLSLGRHGVGFRSVLAVSDRPEIHGLTPAGGRFALGFGAPRLARLAESACAGDAQGCETLLSQAERDALAELLRRRPLSERSLHRHARRWRIPPGALAAAMPVLAFPLWIPDDHVAPRVMELLSDSPAEGAGDLGSEAYVTVIRLPLREPVEQTLAGLKAQVTAGLRCFMGTRVRCRSAL